MTVNVCACPSKGEAKRQEKYMTKSMIHREYQNCKEIEIEERERKKRERVKGKGNGNESLIDITLYRPPVSPCSAK